LVTVSRRARPGASWTVKTAEHAFQALKTKRADWICFMDWRDRPGEAKRMGRRVWLRPDWEEVKDAVMLCGVLEKFETHEEARRILLSTGDQELIEDSPFDSYWGRGSDRKGLNMLGKILMEVRRKLRERSDHKPDIRLAE